MNAASGYNIIILYAIFPNLRTSPSLSYLNGPCRSKCKKEFLRWLPRWNRSLVSPLLLQNQPSSFSDSWVDNASISFGDKPSLGSVPLANDVLWLKLRVAKPASKSTKDSMLQLFSLGHPPSEGNTVVFWACGRGVQPSMVVPKHLCNFANCGFECQRNICHCKLFSIAWVWMSLPHMSNIVYSKNAAIERFSKIGHTGLDSRAQLAMPPLDAVDRLSDDAEVLEVSPTQAPRAPALKKPKATAKASGTPKALKPKPSPKKGATPKATLKRSAASASAASAALKRPASRGGRVKDPNHISVCASKYKSNGIWGIKLAQKEVSRVTWWRYNRFLGVTWKNCSIFGEASPRCPWSEDCRDRCVLVTTFQKPCLMSYILLS